MSNNQKIRLFINGRWVDSLSGQFFDVNNPATGERVCEAADGSDADAEIAINAATEAFHSWSKTSAYERASYLSRCYQLMMENKEYLAQTITGEQGKPIKAARNEVQYAADFLRWYAEEAKRVYGETIPSSRSNHLFITQYDPVGVVAAITPWNYPISMITRKVAPALAAGCTMVLKPAEATPLCAEKVFRLFEQAHLPAGVLNLVTSNDPAPLGNVFTTHPSVNKITFTGSTEVGKLLATQAAPHMKRFSAELGGHAPFIVFADADPAHAAKGAALVKFLNTGQACISPNRLYVHNEIYDEFIKTLAERVANMQAGPGFNETTNIGPLINEKAIEKIQNQVSDATSKGATLVTGGDRLLKGELDKGCFYAPTILTDVTSEMLIYRQETFGPVAAVIRFDDNDDIIQMANDTEYGLAAYIYTQNLSLAMNMFSGLRFGIIGINDINPTSAAAPFGGMKYSGLGREGGKEGIFEYLETKTGGFSI